jgi:hypothetical protein
MKTSKGIRNKLIALIIICLMFFQPISVYALTASEAKQNWYDAKEVSREAQQAHRDAKIDYAVNKTAENNQKVIDTGKVTLHAALDEVEAWLIYVEAELEENPEVPESLLETIKGDIDTNLAKIDGLRAEVNDAETRLQLGIVFLRMIGKYLELVTDVARNTGLVWVHMANTYADVIEDYEQQLRTAAESIQDNEEVINKLDEVKSVLEEAKHNIEDAENEYLQVVLPGSPLACFSNGNQYLRIARNKMIEAHSSLRDAYRLLME